MALGKWYDAPREMAIKYVCAGPQPDNDLPPGNMPGEPNRRDTLQNSAIEGGSKSRCSPKFDPEVRGRKALRKAVSEFHNLGED